MFNAHTHIFTIDHVPVNFLPAPVKLIADLIVKPGTIKFLNAIKLKTLAKMMSRFYAFKKMGELGKQEDVFNHLQGFYPSGSKFVVLSMDMSYMGAGQPPVSFEDQLEELADLKQKYGDLIHPFIFAHPERENIEELVKHYIEEKKFSGIKIYPALGYFPNDPRLSSVYAYAAKNQVPIMTHCTRGGVFYKGKLTAERRTDPDSGYVYPKSSNAKFTDIYSDPDRYVKLLETHPDLKLCFAHFGGAGEWDRFLNNSWHKQVEKNWFREIKGLMRRFDNVYSDVSYTLYHQKYYNLLKVTLLDESLRSKILFGSDYYMQEMETSERAFSLNLRGALGEESFDQIALSNVQNYLRNTVS